MKYVFRISGGINCWDPDEDSYTGGLSSITIRMEYLLAFQYWYCEFCVENRWGEGRKHCIVNFCFLVVLESSVDEGWWGGTESLILGQLKSYLFSAVLFHWFKCETPLLFFLIIFYYISFDQQWSADVLQNRCFPAKLAKFLRTPFFKKDLRWLLLYILYKHDLTCYLSRWNKGYNDIYKKDK